MKKFALFFAALLLCARGAFGQAPSGSFEFLFDNSLTPIINMSGTFQSQQSIIGVGGTPVPLTVAIDITNTMSGALKSAGTTLVQVGENDFLAGNYTASGRVSGGGVNPIRVTLSLRITGQGTVVGLATTFNITLRYNLVFDSATGNLEGTCRGSTGFSNIGGGPVRSDVAVPVPSGSDGSWRLDMEIIPLSRLGGNSTITTSDGRTVPAQLHGDFHPQTGISSLALTGTAEGKGMTGNVKLINSESGVDLDLMRGHVLGQTIHF